MVTENFAYEAELLELAAEIDMEHGLDWYLDAKLESDLEES